VTDGIGRTPEAPELAAAALLGLGGGLRSLATRGLS
jgi:hypothetical protein